MKGLLRAIWIVLICAAPAFAGDMLHMPDGRSYALFTPQSEPRGLILALHGGGGSAERLARRSGLVDAGLGAGFALVFPNGTGRFGGQSWNAGHCCGYAQRNNLDDVRRLETVLSHAQAHLGRDLPIFATGMSNGAMMVQRLMIDAPHLIRAAMTVSGAVDTTRIPPHQPSAPLLHLHGQEDTHVPFDGGVGKDTFAKVAHPPVTQVMQSLSGQGTITECDPVPAQWDGQIACQRFGTGHWVLRIRGGGHIWPGAAPRWRAKEDASGLDAALLSVRFFEAALRDDLAGFHPLSFEASSALRHSLAD